MSRAASIRKAIEHKRNELRDLERELQDVVSTEADHCKDLAEDILCSAREETLYDVEHRFQAKEHFTQAEYQRYGRQLILPEIGPSGQAKLRKARVLVVGLGGLGCPAAAYLAGAGVGTLGLIDGDTVDASNLHRQIIHSTSRVGVSKVDSAIQYLRGLNPLVQYQVYNEHLTPENAIGIFKQYDIVLDCTDHPTSRYLISDTCMLTGKPLISASAIRTDGQLIVLNNPPRPSGDDSGGPCYRCIFPKPPPPDSLVSCGEGGILGPVVGTMGVLQALEVVKLICAEPDAIPVKPNLLMFTGLGQPPFRSVRMRGRRADCASCSASASITAESLTSGSMDYVAFCGTAATAPVLPPEARVSPKEFAQSIGDADTLVVDTRDPTQFSICSLESSTNIPWTGDEQTWLEKARQQEDLQAAKNVIVICRLGNDSQLAANTLIEAGVTQQVKDVKDGFRGWRRDVDPNWPDY